MAKRHFIWLLFSLFCLASVATAQQRKPNLILILADDLGYETIGANGGTSYELRDKTGEKKVIGAKGSTVTYGMHVPLIANWPGKVVAGKVHDGLVDTTDFVPTLLEAANAKAPSSLTLDGRSFLPQLRGRKGNPREWVYAWYSPRQLPNNSSMAVRECAFDRRYKLYRTGEFFDLSNDVEEKAPLKVAALQGEAATAAQRLQKALDRYQHARPAELDRTFEQLVKAQAK